MREPVWPKIPSSFVRRMLGVHSALGLAACALLYLICVTGTVAVFVEELRRWERPVAQEATTTIAPDAVERAVRNVLAAHGTASALYVTLPSPSSPRLLFYAMGEHGEPQRYVASQDGTQIDKFASPWTDFVVELHAELHAGEPYGIFLVGILGVALLSLLVTGLLAHPRIFRDAFTLRWGGVRRLQEADLHNRLSVWGLPFHLVITMTGTFIALGHIVVFAAAALLYGNDIRKAAAPMFGPGPGESREAAPLPDLASLIRRAEQEHAGTRVTSLSLQAPGTAGQRIGLELGSSRRIAPGEQVAFEADGTAIATLGRTTGNFAQQLFGALIPLHFGNFGGLPVKLAYALFGFALSVITNSGVTIWLARRRAQQRPAPRWERVWIATAWGIPAGLLVAAGASIALQAEPLPPFLLGWACCVAYALTQRTADMLVRPLRLLVALLLFSVIAVELAHASDPAQGALVNGVFAACALLLLAAPARRPQARSAPIAQQLVDARAERIGP